MRGDGRSKLGCEGPTTTCGARRSTWLPIPPLIEDALFHCQQAAEKAMKAFLTAHDTAFRKTHDLDELAATREESDASLREALDPARDLTVFAWAFRYPGPDEAPPEAEAHDSLRVAQATVAAIRERLGRLV